MVPKDVYELTGVADPRLSPDGSTVACVVGTVDQKENEYRAAIWLATVDGSQPPRRFTSGEKSDADPRWSPDGSLLAFTSDRADKASQLYVMPVAGGEPRKLTSLKEDVTQAVWSPDGTRIAFVARVRDAAYEEDARKRAPRRLTRLQYKLDSVGWTADRRRHLFVVPADGSAEPVQLTEGDCEDHSPAWSPDGRAIAFISARHDDWDLEMVNDVYLVDAAGGEPRRLTQGGGSVGSVSWAPDGSRLAVDRYEGVFDDPRNSQIALVDLEDGAFTFLTRSLDLNCTTYPGMREPLWDGDGLVFVVEDHGRVHVYRVPADGSDGPRVIAGGERVVTGLDVAAGRLVFTATEPARLSELYDGGPASGSDDPASVGRRLTSVGEEFAAGRELIEPERFTAVSADGSEVDAWIMRPAGWEPGTTYPILLNIHGGPFGQYDVGFFDEFQVYCGAGYAVVFSNPRGSSGGSEEWARAIRGGPDGDGGPGWGSVDYEDCMAVVDEAVRRFDFVDADRLGVIGGSYGGYMTSWIIGHTDRFKAAVSERAVNNFDSQWGSSDFGWDFKGYTGKFLFEDVDLYLKMSPSTYAQDIRTPLLILHSEDDLRCPVEQAEHLFVTLRLLKRPVELVRFPAESHELTRSGSPVHRVQRFEIVIDWFDRHLKP
ncbi:MAG: S9 family peptidase [Actinobacteria bacterium]|nr:S9 family peptidase [Actinomycetota bacterium]